MARFEPVAIPLTFFLVCLAAAAQTPTTPAYTWSATGPLQTARQGACASALPDGRILVAGGQDATGALHSVEIYQHDGTFSYAHDLLSARAGHTCTTLADGRILVAGGAADAELPAAELYDPISNSWAAVDGGTARWNHTATLLPDGRVLLAGGETADGPAALLEWFNPASNHIRSLPSNLASARTQHAAALLPDGSVLVTGGWNDEALLDSTEIVRLDGSIQTAAALPSARAGHTATALDTGCILIAGGVGADGDLKSTLLYCADSAAFRTVADMSVPRYGHLAVHLPANGQVLITGGFSQGEATAVSELFDPVAGTFSPAGSLTLARLGIAAAADPIGGTVLAVGGATADGPVAACGILRNPSVTLDKVVYLDGDTVTASGLGWTPSEKVTISVTTQPFGKSGLLLPSVENAQTFSTNASALGRIQQTLFTAQFANAGATYLVTATGATSGLTASTSARQLSRTTTTLNLVPSLALTRQFVTLQAIVQPSAPIGALDGIVTFQAGLTPLGSVSSTTQVTSVSGNRIIDGTSNTIQIGETLPAGATGFGTSFVALDGSVRFLNSGGVFQFVTRDLPATGNPVNLSASFGAITSPYAPSSATSVITVQKRQVALTLATKLFQVGKPQVGDPVPLTVLVNPTQQPFADLAPTGTAHITIGSATVNAPLTSATAISATAISAPSSQAGLTMTFPAGSHAFSATYDGDSVYLPGTSSQSAFLVFKGNIGFSLIPSKTTFTVGETISVLGRIQHPKVPGATPTGQIARVAVAPAPPPVTIAGDPQNTGTIDTPLVLSGFPPPGNLTVTMNYSGDANFQPATAGAILTIVKALPVVSLIAPAQILAGREATFTVRAAPPAGLSAPPVSGNLTLVGAPNPVSASLVPNAGSSVGTLRLTFPSAGAFALAVQYAGDANYQATTTATIQVVVQ